MGNSSILEKVPGAKGFLGFTRKTSGLRALVGDKTFGNMDLAGQLAGVYDSRYKPQDVPPIPTDDTDAAALVARDRTRRLARQAAGLASTIRTSPAGAALYNPQPKTLLGS